MKKKTLILIVGFIFSLTFTSAGFASGGDQPVVKTYKLEVGVYPDAKMDYAGLIGVLYGERPKWNKADSVKNYPHLLGKAIMSIDLGKNPGDTLNLYLHGELRGHRVKIGKENLKFTQKRVFYPSDYSNIANMITVKLNALSGMQAITIYYGGLFSPSYAGSPSNYMRIDKAGAYLRSYGYSLWVPVLQKAGSDSHNVDFSSVKITTPQKFVSVFTGYRIREFLKEGKRVSLWKVPNIDISSIQLSVRPYVVSKRQNTFLYHLDNSSSQSSSRDIHTFVKGLKNYFSANYKKVAENSQVHVAELPNFASGISSGNMIGITSAQWSNFSQAAKNDSLKLLLAHELVHDFARVKVSRKNPLAALVVEGFPSYFHLPALSEILGEEWYQDYLQRIEKSYKKKKQSGKTRWGTPLPEEKPVLSLTYEDIGEYKDTFILNDRVALFLNYIRENLGKKSFALFTRELFRLQGINFSVFKRLVQKYLPGSGKAIILWLKTSEYPKHLWLKNISK